MEVRKEGRETGLGGILVMLFLSSDPLAQFEVEKREHEIKMKKMETEMEQVFEMKVQEKMQKLKDIEADVSQLTMVGWLLRFDGDHGWGSH